MTSSRPVISVNGLTVRYKDSVALDNVSFTALAGQIVAVVGASGAGKSTLLKLLTGTLTPASGTITLGDGHVDASVGFVPQLTSSGDDCPLSVVEIVTLGKPRNGFSTRQAEREKARLLLERLGLSGIAHRTLSKLSGGQRQRVAIARALFAGANVLICDEPTSGADPVRVAEIMQTLTDIARSGAVVVVSTHDVDRVARRADMIIALREGAVVYCGEASLLDDDTIISIYKTDAL